MKGRDQDQDHVQETTTFSDQAEKKEPAKKTEEEVVGERTEW